MERLTRNFRDLDVEVVSGKASRSDATDEDSGGRGEPSADEAAA